MSRKVFFFSWHSWNLEIFVLVRHELFITSVIDEAAIRQTTIACMKQQKPYSNTINKLNIKNPRVLRSKI